MAPKKRAADTESEDEGSDLEEDSDGSEAFDDDSDSGDARSEVYEDDDEEEEEDEEEQDEEEEEQDEEEEEQDEEEEEENDEEEEENDEDEEEEEEEEEDEVIVVQQKPKKASVDSSKKTTVVVGSDSGNRKKSSVSKDKNTVVVASTKKDKSVVVASTKKDKSVVVVASDKKKPSKSVVVVAASSSAKKDSSSSKKDSSSSKKDSSKSSADGTRTKKPSVTVRASQSSDTRKSSSSSSSDRGSRSNSTPSISEIVATLGKLIVYLRERTSDPSTSPSAKLTYSKQSKIAKELKAKLSKPENSGLYKTMRESSDESKKYLGFNKPTFMTFNRMLKGAEGSGLIAAKTLKVPSVAKGRDKDSDILKLFQHMNKVEGNDFYDGIVKVWKKEIKKGNPLKRLIEGEQISQVGTGYLESVIAPYVSGADSFEFTVKDMASGRPKKVKSYFSDVLDSEGLEVEFYTSDVSGETFQSVKLGIENNVTVNFAAYLPRPNLMRVYVQNFSRHDIPKSSKGMGLIQFFADMKLDLIKSSTKLAVYLFGKKNRKSRTIEYIQVIYVARKEYMETIRTSLDIDYLEEAKKGEVAYELNVQPLGIAKSVKDTT